MTDNDIKITITVRAREDGKPAYMGAHISFPPEPGETHRRGNDYPDGDLGMETLARIFQRIIDDFQLQPTAVAAVSLRDLTPQGRA